MNEWIEWEGGECPVSGSVRLDVQTRNGCEYTTDFASRFDWKHDGDGGDIIAYRVASGKAEAPAGDEPVPVYDGGPAFPHGHSLNGWDFGMSLRAYAAVAAMQGMLACDDEQSEELAAEKAVNYADALLAALKGKSDD